MMRIEGAIAHVRQRIADLKLERASECYSVSEAVYLLAGGKKSGLTVHYIQAMWLDELVAHWFLRGPWGEVIDLTAGQFGARDDDLPPYNKARRGMFYPTTSGLAKKLMDHAPDPLIATGLYSAWQLQG